MSKLDANQIIQALYNDATGAISVAPVSGSLVTASYDAITASYPDAVTEVYTYKSGGVGGTVVNTLTVIYTDATKTVLSSVART